MKLRNIPIWLTTWMSRLDRKVSLDRCCTNPYLATFLLYVFLVMGVMRYFSSTEEVFETMDDIYDFMLPQDEGLGIMCLIFCSVETIMLCGGIADILTRFAIIVLVANFLYMMGLFLPVMSQGLLILVGAAYIYMIIVVIRNAIAHLRDSRRFSNPGSPQ